MMSSEGVGAQAAAVAADPNMLQNYRADASQGHTYQYYPSPSGSAPVSWPVQEGDHTSAGNRSVQHVSYQYNPQQPSIVQDTTSVPSTSTSTASGTDNSSHMYANYATYPTSTNPYGYASSEYTNYYSGYQQQPTQLYTQATGAYQNSGSPYQPISSFQNPGSYAGSTSYSSTYYNPGDYQTTGAYTGSDYNNQTNLWSQGNYTNYPHQYGNYSHDSSSTYSSSNAAAATDYQQHCQQWADYYSSQTAQTEVTCAPGTENTAVPATAALPCPIPGVSSGYAAPVSQPQASYTPAWKPETTPPALPSQQASSTVGAYDDYWIHAAQTFQNQPTPSLQSNFQKPQAPHPSVQDQQQTLAPQLAHLQYTEVQQTLAPQLPHLQYAEGEQTYPQHMQQNYPQPTQQTYPQPTQHTYPQSAQQTYPQPVKQTYPTQQPYPTQQTYSQQPAQSLAPADTLRVSKLQIPTNPRIASHLAMPKTVKNTATSSVASKPAYVSVSLSNPNNKVLSSSAPDSNLKPGVFPASLRGYVERALARCKDEKQRAASQEVMKEIITKATADGTLYSRDWDIEPLFPLPDISTENNGQSTAPVVSMSILKRSPSRRTKSRWEPLPEDKPIEKPTSTYQDSARHGLGSHFNGRDHKSVAGKSERKDAPFSRLSTVEQNSASRSFHRPSKKQRLNNGLSAAAENGDASSDSDKEQGLTAYYSGATTLANSPEERKRRESRSKRFERGNGHRTENRFRPKNVNSGSLYARRATALVLSKTFDDGGSRAVEDIDWDALTVKGTCQDIEKRYLRLTSAPDPSTVRPEEVLEKALHMVQNSQKNYLYKCDQLKSIRQDLTVQRIRNGLTVKVYETHARLALEFGDLPEFNQSQSQLKSLYGEGIEGCHMEFSAYNLLSISLLSNNRRDLLSLMSSKLLYGFMHSYKLDFSSLCKAEVCLHHVTARLSDETKKHEAVKHALLVRSAVTSGNYVLFFKLYKSAPNLNTCLMDLCVEKMRFEAVKCMSRTYRPTIPVLYVAQVLGFSNTPEGDEVDVDGLEECTEWLKAHGACLIADNNGELMIDAKASTSSLYMPEPEDAVAHGDANLAVNDFFTRTST